MMNLQEAIDKLLDKIKDDYIHCIRDKDLPSIGRYFKRVS